MNSLTIKNLNQHGSTTIRSLRVFDERTRLAYALGGLLYTPPYNPELADKIAAGAIPGLTSLAFCLEDAILDEALPQAELEFCRNLAAIKDKNLPSANLPLMFVRVRTPQHLQHIQEFLGDFSELLCGYILPKFDLSNSAAYIDLIRQINAGRQRPLYFMPILESRMLADLVSRRPALQQLKDELARVQKYILNVRVGCNDFCSLFGLRRSVQQNIYQISVVRDILADIVNMFSDDYVLSGPVWEYFGDNPVAPWAQGLRAELALDRLNGFVGKTAVHPAQLPIIYDSLKVSRADYDDALHLLDWLPDNLGVAKSADGSRMNELKCHTNWALKTAVLAEIYGIIDDE